MRIRIRRGFWPHYLVQRVMLGKPSFGGVSRGLGYVFLALDCCCVLVDCLVAGVS